MSPNQSVFSSGLLRHIEFLKSPTNMEDIYARSLPLEKGQRGYWIPVSSLLLRNSSIFKSLESAQWAVQEGSFSLPNPGSDKELNWVLQDPSGQIQGYCKTQWQDGILSIAAVALTETEFESTLPALIEWYRVHNGLEKIQLAFQPKQAELWQRQGFQNQSNAWIHSFHRIETPSSMILTAGPSISAREVSYALDAVRYGWNSEHSKYLQLFEKSFSSYIGTSHSLATSSCTGALHLALAALGVGPGDEVLVPEITWVATATAVKYVGAQPVFVDIDPKNWCMDPEKIESKISPRTKCIMPVHLYGHPCDMDSIMTIAKKHGLFVVEDAAPAIGAKSRDRKVGTYGDFAAFSFQGAKLLVTGEGGILVTQNPDLYKKAYALWDHGRTPGTFWINQVGYKYKMSNIQAALGLGQLEHVEEQIAYKRQISDWYFDELKNFDLVEMHRESAWAKSIYWMSSLTISEKSKINRDELFKALKDFKIDTRPTFPAISQYPMWKRDDVGPIAKSIGDRGVNLPSGVNLKEEEVRYVARKIKSVLSSSK